VQIKSAVDVDDTAVQQMVEESVEHAFDDLAARRWVEAKIKAEAMAAATRKGLVDAGDEIAPEYRQQVAQALEELASVLLERPDTGTGDVKVLQTACAKLDEVTKPLAELLMDKAMETLLRKRGLIH
jgi:molecular chaperone DnaK (HSP70)